jgi:hypothetical protein
MEVFIQHMATLEDIHTLVTEAMVDTVIQVMATECMELIMGMRHT